MSNEVAASSSQIIMDKHLSHSDEVAKDINNYDEIDNTNDDEVVDQSEIILDQASDNEGNKNQREMDNDTMHVDLSNLVSSMDNNNFIYDERTNCGLIQKRLFFRPEFSRAFSIGNLPGISNTIINLAFPLKEFFVALLLLIDLFLVST